ncbi:methionyl-tRNA formyltransferase [Dysgonomonas sp. PH5-45]|uniref:methionyl-tRNA formyltransferase n=1 Tax=unclassified Dysgonomonas TaxID=2630389 RepID=UPI002475FC2D|nr:MULTISPECIES: methionyl-tRNA formyltransferase [unclassified Dysgonomonas]MDH6354397.1 methionyl-tRNA formyltransferase [Dysgonomonas sp. PH5-45]MDH6387296.1 methionyl-tRNA formyltransferase [Dysgonomonas sp. PH5-37]
MDKKDLRIVYMGTPDFAVESLRVLVENGYNVVGVVTMPDKPSGRGHKIQYSPVKKYALENNLPLLQPEKLKDENFLADLRAWNADLQIVVAFRMLPEAVWNMPRLGTFNLHASLLPQYRGAAPINWAVINGETETGVTTFFLTHEIDTGKIILQEKTPIAQSDNVGKIHDRLMTIGSLLVRKTVDLILENKIETIPQEQFYKNESELKAAPKIFKETCRINWAQPTEKVYNLIRGLSPYPAAWTELHSPDKEPVNVKIYEAEVIRTDKKQAAGSIFTDGKGYIDIACTDGMIRVLSIQMPGKKAMKTDELLRGYKFTEGSCFK